MMPHPTAPLGSFRLFKIIIHAYLLFAHRRHAIECDSFKGNRSPSSTIHGSLGWLVRASWNEFNHLLFRLSTEDSHIGIGSSQVGTWRVFFYFVVMCCRFRGTIFVSACEIAPRAESGEIRKSNIKPHFGNVFGPMIPEEIAKRELDCFDAAHDTTKYWKCVLLRHIRVKERGEGAARARECAYNVSCC